MKSDARDGERDGLFPVPVPPGCVALVGHSGSGKTQLAAALLFGLPLFQGPGPAAPSRAPLGASRDSFRCAPVAGAVTLDLLASWLPRLQSLVAQGFERIVYVGANELKGLAHEEAPDRGRVRRALEAIGSAAAGAAPVIEIARQLTDLLTRLSH